MNTTDNTQNTSANSSADKFYDLTTQARFFPSFAREVKGKNSPGYERLNASAAFGKVGQDTLRYVQYDVKVCGEQTLADYLSVKDAINDENKTVRMQVVIGDAAPEIYEWKGENRVSMKGRLLKIVWCSVDGELVVDNRNKPEADAEVEAEPAEQSAEMVETVQGSPEPAAVEDRMVG